MKSATSTEGLPLDHLPVPVAIAIGAMGLAARAALRLARVADLVNGLAWRALDAIDRRGT